jgi:hypothetical protein
LATPAVLSDNVGIVCLERDIDKLTVGQPLTVSGWGLENYHINDSYSVALKSVEVTGVDVEQCRYANGGIMPWFDTSNQMCAAKAGSDACVGDSGGKKKCL